MHFREIAARKVKLTARGPITEVIRGIRRGIRLSGWIIATHGACQIRVGPWRELTLMVFYLLVLLHMLLVGFHLPHTFKAWYSGSGTKEIDNRTTPGQLEQSYSGVNPESPNLWAWGCMTGSP
jgi:hypothetical protein